MVTRAAQGSNGRKTRRSGAQHGCGYREGVAVRDVRASKDNEQKRDCERGELNVRSLRHSDGVRSRLRVRTTTLHGDGWRARAITATRHRMEGADDGARGTGCRLPYPAAVYRFYVVVFLSVRACIFSV